MIELNDTIINGNLKVNGTILYKPYVVYFLDGQMSNGWINYDINAWGYASYWKDHMGIVHMSGLIKNGTIGAMAFTLQHGFWPEKNKLFNVLSGDNMGRVTVGSNGAVDIDAPSTNGWVSLNEISYLARN